MRSEVGGSPNTGQDDFSSVLPKAVSRRVNPFAWVLLRNRFLISFTVLLYFLHVWDYQIEDSCFHYVY